MNNHCVLNDYQTLTCLFMRSSKEPSEVVTHLFREGGNLGFEKLKKLLKASQWSSARAGIQTLWSVFRAHALWFCLETLNTPIFYLEGLNFALVLTHVKWSYYNMAEVSDVFCVWGEKSSYMHLYGKVITPHIIGSKQSKVFSKGSKEYLYTYRDR